jgi:hypothetical protein|tara:strand:- start:3447 stop:3623 length:177 start_codon:yes stop_codon:yes gene_type:complete
MSDDLVLDTGDNFEEERAPVLSDKRQAEVDHEARQRLEKKLEEARIKKQTEYYDFDFD